MLEARNIITKISIVQEYEQEKIAGTIVILRKRKTNFSHDHLSFGTAQIQLNNDRSGRKSRNPYSPDQAYA